MKIQNPLGSCAIILCTLLFSCSKEKADAAGSEQISTDSQLSSLPDYSTVTKQGDLNRKGPLFYREGLSYLPGNSPGNTANHHFLNFLFRKNSPIPRNALFQSTTSGGEVDDILWRVVTH